MLPFKKSMPITQLYSSPQQINSSFLRRLSFNFLLPFSSQTDEATSPLPLIRLACIGIRSRTSTDHLPHQFKIHSKTERMKIQCDVCHKVEASVFCSADEAVLCDGCDHNIHHANKLASKHPRYSLMQPTFKESPLCDVCQVYIHIFLLLLPSFRFDFVDLKPNFHICARAGKEGAALLSGRQSHTLQRMRPPNPQSQRAYPEAQPFPPNRSQALRFLLHICGLRRRLKYLLVLLHNAEAHHEFHLELQSQ